MLNLGLILGLEGSNKADPVEILIKMWAYYATSGADPTTWAQMETGGADETIWAALES